MSNPSTEQRTLDVTLNALGYLKERGLVKQIGADHIAVDDAGKAYVEKEVYCVVYGGRLN